MIAVARVAEFGFFTDIFSCCNFDVAFSFMSILWILSHILIGIKRILESERYKLYVHL